MHRDPVFHVDYDTILSTSSHDAILQQWNFKTLVPEYLKCASPKTFSEKNFPESSPSFALNSESKFMLSRSVFFSGKRGNPLCSKIRTRQV
ncbi:hypothetical protein CEXT_702261 [Caerostris extrusa]|uniref:Uncharacterized protein n=1 Tax=Caerostris extrusa TaxID=172846 RepID=A0AAV4XW28_CAEEX|nr:hypothetical protein CEXT_702261 [Caerostris extrusa]